MIHYTLKCANEHEFDGWFQNSETSELQLQQSLVNCPHCQSNQIHKALMAPHLAKTDRLLQSDTSGTEDKPPVASPMAAMPLSDDPQAQRIRQLLGEMRRYVETHAENVGTDFAQEARRMHFGEAKERPIYGRASLQEAHELLAEGIEVMPLPENPDERH